MSLPGVDDLTTLRQSAYRPPPPRSPRGLSPHAQDSSRLSGQPTLSASPRRPRPPSILCSCCLSTSHFSKRRDAEDWGLCQCVPAPAAARPSTQTERVGNVCGVTERRRGWNQPEDQADCGLLVTRRPLSPEGTNTTCRKEEGMLTAERIGRGSGLKGSHDKPRFRSQCCRTPLCVRERVVSQPLSLCPRLP